MNISCEMVSVGLAHLVKALPAYIDAEIRKAIAQMEEKSPE